MSKREWIWWGIWVIFLGIFVAFNVFANGQDVEQKDPKLLISAITYSAILELRANEDVDPHELVERILMPHVDVLKMSKLILGRNFSRMTLEQQEEFALLFETTLKAMYAAYLLQYKDTMAITFRPTSFNTDSTRAAVKMRLHLTVQTKVDTTFLLHNLEGKWYIYNFSIDGINFGIVYRNTYAQLIRSLGIEGVLERMREKLNKLEIAE